MELKAIEPEVLEQLERLARNLMNREKGLSMDELSYTAKHLMHLVEQFKTIDYD